LVLLLTNRLKGTDHKESLPMAAAGLICFLSHKCNVESHAIGLKLHEAVQPMGISLLRDPFNPGEDVLIKIDTLEFNSFVFLHSSESWGSEMCQHELEIAKIRGVPVIAVLVDETRCDELRSRIWIDASPNNGGLSDAKLESLCLAIQAHAQAYRAAHTLGPDNAPEEALESAKCLVDEVDAALIGEHLQHIAASYRRDTDIQTRHWIALAVGKVGSRVASAVLDGFEWEDQPLPREGIRQARDMLSRSGLLER
jgi:hypothetical protein